MVFGCIVRWWCKHTKGLLIRPLFPAQGFLGQKCKKIWLSQPSNQLRIIDFPLKLESFNPLRMIETARGKILNALLGKGNILDKCFVHLLCLWRMISKIQMARTKTWHILQKFFLGALASLESMRSWRRWQKIIGPLTKNNWVTDRKFSHFSDFQIEVFPLTKNPFHGTFGWRS